MDDKKQMENLFAPSFPEPKEGQPTKARVPEGLEEREGLFVRTIKGAADLYNDACTGGDDYANDCAHFLSDAFIRAGFTELSSPNDCIEARCGSSAKRPVRARNMWCWFKKMASETASSLPSNQGYWAVFQLDESEYWGGHVVIIDTDANQYYGTGNFPNWTQYCYKW